MLPNMAVKGNAKKSLAISRSIQKLGRAPTPFELRVYQLAAVIPSGKVTTYGELAKALGSSSRAVGQALRRNPFAPEVPCHRVIKTSLDIGGFFGTIGDSTEVREKIAMLQEEGVKFSGSTVARAAFVVDSIDLQNLAAGGLSFKFEEV